MESQILQFIFEELNKYENKGSFSFNRNHKLSKVCNAPNKAGVYYILKVSCGKKKLVYIGSSGTMKQDGNLCNQLLCRRIRNKQGGTSRQKYFTSQLNDTEELEIYWIVTYDENIKHLPKHVEGILVQKYFELNGCLPLWNNQF